MSATSSSASAGSSMYGNIGTAAIGAISSIGQIAMGIMDKKRADKAADQVEEEARIQAWLEELEAVRNRDTRTAMVAHGGGDVNRTGVFQIAQAALFEAWRADWIRYQGAVEAENLRYSGMMALAGAIAGAGQTLAGTASRMERPGSGQSQTQQPSATSDRDFEAYVSALEGGQLGQGRRPLGPVSSWPTAGDSAWQSY